MTCAKQSVTATIIGASGRHYTGMNACRSPQQTCPREDGEGYDKCKTICRQLGHAEDMALRLAGDDARGGRVVVVGHTAACAGCRALLAEAGVEIAGCHL